MKVLFDWSVLCHTCWHVMRSQNYEARTDIEAAEFARNLASTVLYYIERFKPKEVVFALDSREGYWRHKVMEDYYKTHCVVSEYLEEEATKPTYVLEYDLRVYRVSWVEGPDKWVAKKLTKAERAEVDEIETILVPYADVPDDIKKFFPAYKGSRKDSSWDYATTREEWYRLCEKIVKNLAVTTGAKVLSCPKAEADDIAKVYADINSAHDAIFITTDSDWSQMLSDHMFLKLFNPTKREFLDLEPHVADHHLAVKLIAGDTSDSIPAISLEGAAATIGPKKADDLVMEVGIKKIYDYLEENADHDALYRNYELIFLENIPEDLERKIDGMIATAKIATSQKPFKYSHFGVTSKDVLTIKGEAKEARKIDLEVG